MVYQQTNAFELHIRKSIGTSRFAEPKHAPIKQPPKVTAPSPNFAYASGIPVPARARHSPVPVGHPRRPPGAASRGRATARQRGNHTRAGLGAHHRKYVTRRGTLIEYPKRYPPYRQHAMQHAHRAMPLTRRGAGRRAFIAAPLPRDNAACAACAARAHLTHPQRAAQRRSATGQAPTSSRRSRRR